MIRDIFGELAIDYPWFVSLAGSDDVRGLMKILYDIGFLGDFVPRW